MIKVGPFGDVSSRGTAFDDLGKKGVCRIYVSHGTYLNSIQIAYAEENTIVLSDKWGETGTGTYFDSVVLDYPTEVLTGIRGSLDDSMILTISFVTNLKTYGPFGTEPPPDRYKLKKFGINFGPDDFFGLHGRVDSGYIRAIGVYIKPSGSTSSALARMKSEPSS